MSSVNSSPLAFILFLHLDSSFSLIIGIVNIDRKIQKLVYEKWRKFQKEDGSGGRRDDSVVKRT